MTLLPDNILKAIADPVDKKRLGKAGRTMPEHLAEYSAKLERQLHYDYISFLKRHGFKDHEIYHSPMGKRSKFAPGHPDFLVQRGGKFLYVEFKAGSNCLDPLQEIVIADLIASGCTCLVLYSHSEAIVETIKYFNL